VRMEIRTFADRYGLADAAVDELEALVRRLERADALALSTLDETLGDRDPVSLEGPPATPRDRPGDRIAGRYEDLGPIGTGGMGEVRRVRDVQLNRTLAMKILHASLLPSPAVRARFLDEAQATAQLQHPNIVPVHDAGELPDGRLWFTMKEVRGRTLSRVLRDAEATRDARLTFRRLVEAFLAVCRAVAYAHERGVVHRDLKPSNVMVGELGEVYVLDWGLAKLPRREGGTGISDVDLVRTVREDAGPLTQPGRVVGTPAYMPPEQARGWSDRVDVRTDVYALGAVLYELLSGRAPYRGRTSDDVLRQVLKQPPEPLEPSEAVPAELVATCERAMSREIGQRHQTARELAAEIEVWLDGARRREQALALTERALRGVGGAEASLAEAAARRAESEALLAGVAPWRPEEDKAPAWALADEARRLERAAALQELRLDQELHAALQVDPRLPEAHAALAERYRERHALAEARRDPDAVAVAQLQLETHAHALPPEHPTRAACAAYLTGDGALTLVTDPPGAEVHLFRYVERNRRLVPSFERVLGPTPLVEWRLSMGSYLCELRHPERAPVRYPVHVTRLGHWHGVPPGEAEAQPIWLPPPGHLGPDEVYVPAGWFLSGGDEAAANAHPARWLWAEGLIVHRFPVTNLAFVAFLDDLVAQGREDEALRFVPRQRAGQRGQLGAAVYGRTPTGGFVLRVDPEGHVWRPDDPVIQVTWHAARAFLQWLGARSQRPWRLLGELEWEKAARGVDGRFFPWGDHIDPTWCRMRQSVPPAESRTAPVDSYPVDQSPYGVRGTGGNVRDWCAEPWTIDALAGQTHGERVVSPPPLGDPTTDGPRANRGGAYFFGESHCRLGFRSNTLADGHFSNLGVRGCRSLDEGVAGAGSGGATS